MKRQFSLFIISILFLAAIVRPAITVSVHAQVKRFDIATSGKIVRVGDPEISPDGKSVVIVVGRANMDDDRWDNQLVLVDVASGGRRVLTHERRDVSQPRWSPNGDRLAFLSAAPTGRETRPQIFVLSMSGGEAHRVTSAPTGVQHYSWKPDGSEIAYVSADESKNPKVGDREIVFEIGNNDYLTTASINPSHIWLVSSEGGKAKRLTSGEWSLPITLPPGSPSSPLSWSPDGKSIAFVKRVSPYYGDQNESAVQILDVATGNIRPLTGRSARESQPVFSPDGSKIAYWYPREGGTVTLNEINVTSASGGEGATATHGLDRHTFRSLWMPDSKSFITGGDDGTRVSLWQQNLDGSAHKLDLGDVNPSGSFWIECSISKNGELAFTGSAPHRPAELYYLQSPNAKPKRLTEFNAEIEALDLGKVEAVEWDNDNLHMDGVVTYPPDFSAGRKYPLVLYIHGGPTAATKQSFGALPQLLAAQGWIVFEPNYRGSDNLGYKFQHAIFNDAGAGPGRDVMAGIELLKKRGFVDESRMAVSGWSYGGYMTTWLIGHYQVWKAAVSGAAVTDWMDQYNVGDSNVARSVQFGGSPWKGDFEKAYRDQSPITYAKDMRTPTLILSDTGDVRVPITQSYKLYHALRDNGVQVRFFAYPVSGHSPGDPIRQQDVNKRWIDWLSQYLK